MEINKKEFCEFLRSMGINHLYHANTVQTSCTFIDAGGLLSRGAVEAYNLIQTFQSSDNIDKKYNVWNDIFLDSYDLHNLFKRRNYYGPVSFKFNIDILNDERLPKLWITKDNPIYWRANQKNHERYFKNILELKQNYSEEVWKKMITLRDTFEPLSFNPYLEQIILDNPLVRIGDIRLFKEAKVALINALERNNMDTSILVTRKCKFNCSCRINYLEQVRTQELKKLFLLKDKY